MSKHGELSHEDSGGRRYLRAGGDDFEDLGDEELYENEDDFEDYEEEDYEEDDVDKLHQCIYPTEAKRLNLSARPTSADLRLRVESLFNMSSSSAHSFSES
jgi:hypothetical protein